MKNGVLWITGTPGSGKTTFSRQLGLPVFSTDRFVQKEFGVKAAIGKWLRRADSDAVVDVFFQAYDGEPVIEGWMPSHILNRIVARMDARVWVAYRN